MKGEMRGTSKPEGRRPPGKPRRRWQNNLFNESDGNREGVCGSHSTRFRYGQETDCCIYGNKPPDSATGKDFIDGIGDYQITLRVASQEVFPFFL
jgi:hypothetical protein